MTCYGTSKSSFLNFTVQHWKSIDLLLLSPVMEWHSGDIPYMTSTRCQSNDYGLSTSSSLVCCHKNVSGSILPWSEYFLHGSKRKAARESKRPYSISSGNDLLYPESWRCNIYASESFIRATCSKNTRWFKGE